MSTMGPAFVIDGPVPRPPSYRLLDVAEIIDEPGIPHWLNGGAVWPYPAAAAYTFDPCAGGSLRVKAEAGVIPLPEFGAFTVYVTETCTNRSVGDFDFWRDRALLTLEAAESFAVEREFASGQTLPGNPFLADANADVLNGGITVASQAGVGFLANAIGASEIRGIIHATPAHVAAWGQRWIRTEGDSIFAVDGTQVVSGAGYIGVTPDGESDAGDGEGWAFASGPVQIRRTEAEFIPGERFQAVDRSDNTITYRAERHYLVTWDTYLQAAVLIDWTT